MKIPKAQPYTPAAYEMNYSQPKINYAQVIYIIGRYKCGKKFYFRIPTDHQSILYYCARCKQNSTNSSNPS
jgi:hypothetical protein